MIRDCVRGSTILVSLVVWALLLSTATLSGCASQTPKAKAYETVAAACTALKQAILARHGEDATAKDEADYEATKRVCEAALAEIESSGGEQ